MAVVYAATHRNGKHFAIKVLHPELSSRRELRARFLREGYVANSVKHSGVVAVLDDEDDEDSAFLVMELLEGASVESLCEGLGRRLPVKEALAIVHQLLDVLEAAHQSDVIHRDIKPANLFLVNDGQLKVLDFGIARLRDVSTSHEATRTGAMLGTPAFMAPEQALGDASNVDARSDVWAAGATLFTLLSGQLVHEGDNGRQVLVRAATTPARSLDSVAPDVPAEVVEVVTRALQFDRAARWQSAGAMRDAVAAVHERLFGAVTREPLRELISSHAAARSSADLPTLDTHGREQVDRGQSTTWKPVSTHGSASTARGGRSMIALAVGVALLSAVGAALLSERTPPSAPPVTAAQARPLEPPPHAEPPAKPAPPLPEEQPAAPKAAPAARSAAPAKPRPSAAAVPASPAPAASTSGPPRSPLELELQ
jgi:eukaryotic-like serine/threonine-protein kinase